MQGDERLRAVERATQVPLLVLALVMVPLLIVPWLFDLPDGVESTFVAADWFIWAIFAADFGLKLAVAPRRAHYIAHHPFDVAMVVLPVLRPLRLARLIRIARLATVLGVNLTLVREIVATRGVQFVVGSVLACLVAGAAGVFLAERGNEGGNITSFGDALWWSATTMTTVGYGDRFPVTAEGRAIAVVLMVFGIAALSALTATIAAVLVREEGDRGPGATNDEILAEVRNLRRELEAMRNGRRGP